jgi:hypothetical protein
MQGWEGAERSSSGRGVVAIGQLLIGEERKGEGGSQRCAMWRRRRGPGGMHARVRGLMAGSGASPVEADGGRLRQGITHAGGSVQGGFHGPAR